MATSLEKRLRERVRAAIDGGTTYRDLAARIGVSSFVLWKLLDDDPKREKLRATTLRRLQDWLEDPEGVDVGRQLRAALRRVVGRLKARDAKRVEGEIGRTIADALTDAGEEVPKWVRLMGKGQK